ncbi:568_t:CDS:10 [Paraglomus brasilianum]|uniref:568_t:CDS:1 n=1 Tax=Paraglomus brasilianum TaxID=144538 RepID=A0A9N9G3J4_9GLOM|nr:568_t:CDS:10 [Paraglomus brasilianum]
MSEHYPGHEEKHTDWSYREFLTLHHDVIVASPPFSDDWYGLDGAWFHRFLRKGAPSLLTFRLEVSVDILAQVESERQNKALLNYWEEIIHERKKLAVKRTHVNGSLDILNEAGRYNKEAIILEGLSNPFLKRGNVALTTLTTKFMKHANKIQMEEEEDVEVDDAEETENNHNIDAEEANISVSGITGERLTDASMKEYTQQYEDMDDKYKWKLESGRRVEDVLYEFGCSRQFEHLAHSFTIDLDDRQMKSLFKDEEWKEILETNVKDDPTLDDDLERCINAFAKTNLADIREAMSQFTTCRGAKYSVQQDFAVDAIVYAVHSLVLLYERQPNALGVEHHEQWYNVNLWGPVIDKAFGDINGIDIVRGESCSFASSERKNRKRKRTHRKSLGRRGDAIIRKNSGGQVLEFGGSEAGRWYTGKGGSKWLVETGLKLPKTLRDMFAGLCSRVKWRAHIIQKLETIGYIHGGRVLMLMALDNPSGYVMRLTKSDVFEIPEDVASFALALELIAAVWMSKVQMRVQRTMNLVQEIPLDLKRVGMTNRKTAVHQLPASLTTPEKKKR